MAETILFQYPLDLTGTLSSNKVTIKGTLGAGKVNRAFAFPSGPFYTDGFVLSPANDPSVKYTRGVEYELIILHPQYTAMARGKEVATCVLVKDPKVPSDIVCTAQVVGGPQSSNLEAVQQAIKALNLDAKVVEFKDLRDVPDTFQASPSFRDVGDIYGFEYIISVLAGIKDAIAARSTVQLEEIKSTIDDLKTTFLAAVTAHANATGNVHHLDIHQADGLTETEIRQLIQGVQVAIDATIADINDLRAADVEINKRIDALVASLASWNDQLNSVAQNYQKMALITANLDSKVLELSKKVTELNNALNAANDRIAALEQQGGEHTQQVGDLTAKLEALKQQVQNNTLGIATVNQNLANHTNADNPHTQYLHKQYGGVVQATVHVNANLTSRNDVQAEAGQK